MANKIVMKSGLQLSSETVDKVSFQVHAVDQILRGGISVKGLTEISGEAGSGKSQLAMHLCLTVQLPKNSGGLEKKAIYINTEGSFSTKRLEEMASAMIKRHKLQVTSVDMLRNLIYFSLLDYESLIKVIDGQLQRILQDEPIGLIVIDSIAAVFSLHNDYIDRAIKMRNLVITLQSLSKKHNFATVCINQVRSNPNSEETAPALGLAWANLVTTRLQIYKLESDIKERDGAKVQKRGLKITWAPNLPMNQTTFYINSRGIS